MYFTSALYVDRTAIEARLGDVLLLAAVAAAAAAASYLLLLRPVSPRCASRRHSHIRSCPSHNAIAIARRV
jgi:hypothetical protein